LSVVSDASEGHVLVGAFEGAELDPESLDGNLGVPGGERAGVDIAAEVGIEILVEPSGGEGPGRLFGADDFMREPEQLHGLEKCRGGLGRDAAAAFRYRAEALRGFGRCLRCKPFEFGRVAEGVIAGREAGDEGRLGEYGIVSGRVPEAFFCRGDEFSEAELQHPFMARYHVAAEGGSEDTCLECGVGVEHEVYTVLRQACGDGVGAQVEVEGAVGREAAETFQFHGLGEVVPLLKACEQVFLEHDEVFFLQECCEGESDANGVRAVGRFTEHALERFPALLGHSIAACRSVEHVILEGPYSGVQGIHEETVRYAVGKGNGDERDCLRGVKVVQVDFRKEVPMSEKAPTREDAWELLKLHNGAEALRNHALSVEAVMRYIARKHGEDEEKWGVIGLIHDLDYEKFPEQHCLKTREMLEEAGWPEEYIRAAISHGWGVCNDVEPRSLLEKTLYAIDELTGLVAAAALVRPSRSVMDMEVKSVKKKWKQKAFAAGVDREVIDRGAQMLDVERSELIRDAIMGMREVSAAIGL
jgi:predicted hydrolase (HD superfamily)